MTPSKILRNAHRLIVTRGWVQGCYDDPDKGHCPVGAILACGKAIADPAVTKALILLQQAIGDYGAISTWNDHPRRTKEEVLAVLIKAAEIGEPERRRVLVPNEMPATPLTPDSPIWTDPAPEEPKRVPERVPA